MYKGYLGLPKHIKFIFIIFDICFIVIINPIFCFLAIGYCLTWGLGPPGLQSATAAGAGAGEGGGISLGIDIYPIDNIEAALAQDYCCSCCCRDTMIMRGCRHCRV